jgi:outer membrane protein W
MHRKITLALALLLVLVAADAAPAKLRGFIPRSRHGAEVSVEIPRYILPLGDGFVGDFAIDEGWGFGFGLMLGFADKLGLEARTVQSNHRVAAGEWDLDQTFVGLKYCFVRDSAFQPFVSAGYCHQLMETDSIDAPLDEFTRLSGHGAYASAGIDYFRTSKFLFSVRVDYVLMDFTRGAFGIDEGDLDSPLDANGFAASLSIGYRAPIW